MVEMSEEEWALSFLFLHNISATWWFEMASHIIPACALGSWFPPIPAHPHIHDNPNPRQGTKIPGLAMGMVSSSPPGEMLLLFFC